MNHNDSSGLVLICVNNEINPSPKVNSSPLIRISEGDV